MNIRNFVFVWSVFMITSCSDDKDLQQHNQLEKLKVEIEMHIANDELDSASSKLKNLIHPSDGLSTIEFDNDLTTKEGWGEALKHSASTYRYNEYWQEQRTALLEELKSKLHSKNN